MNMYVNMDALWFVYKKMAAQTLRLEDLVTELEEIQAVNIGKIERSKKFVQCKARMEQEIVFEKQLCFALERIIKNYEQMERDALLILEDGIREQKRTEIECVCFAEIERQLELIYQYKE